MGCGSSSDSVKSESKASLGTGVSSRASSNTRTPTLRHRGRIAPEVLANKDSPVVAAKHADNLSRDSGIDSAKANERQRTGKIEDGEVGVSTGNDAQNNNVKPVYQKGVAFEVDLKDGNKESLIKKHPPRRLQKLENAPRPKLTLEELEEQQKISSKRRLQEHRIESIDERMESSREFNFNAAFLELSRNKFVASPSVEELDSLKKSEIVKVAKHYGAEFQPLMRKDEIKRYVLEYLVDESILPITVLETAITVPTDNTFELKRLEIEMNKEIRLKEMEREREREEREMQKVKEEREMQMQMQKEKEEREMQMQMQKEKEEREMQMQREKEAREHEFRLKQLELGVIKGSDPKIGLDTGGLFDVSKHVKFVPKFQEDNVEKFFNHFEKLGEQLKWPRDKWSILIQSNFTGKAQEVYSALSIEDSMDYDKVKKAILQAYELVPEAYRQKFRKYRKADTQTYVEFAYQKERQFDRWCASKKVSTFDTLRQLMLVEEFKRCVNDDIKTHLEENKADNLKEVANLADQYALTHKFSKVGQTQNKGQFSRPNKKYGNSSGTTGNSGSQSGSISPTNSGKKQPDSSRQKNDQVSSNKAAFKDISCGFCHKKGHTMANCFTLAKLKETETASNALANVENSSEVVVTLRPNSNDKIKEEYLPFVSEGFISLDGNSAHPPVKIKILRDTGATQSLLLDGVLPLSDSTSTGANVLIQGVECGFISVPLHKINLKSDLVSGSVIVGVRPTLPVKGVSLLLGNDLAGGKVVANAILTDKPCDYNNTEQLEKEFPNLFPTCAVTRAMSQKLAMDDNLKHPSSNSEDTVPKSGTSKESCKDDNLKHPLSKNEGMISENKDDKLNHPPSKIEELVPKNGTALPKEESESGKDSSKNIHESEDSWYDLSQSFMTNLNDSQDCESPGPTHSEGVEQEKSKMSDTLHRDQLSVQQQHDEELQPLIAGALTEDESKDALEQKAESSKRSSRRRNELLAAVNFSKEHQQQVTSKKLDEKIDSASKNRERHQAEVLRKQKIRETKARQAKERRLRASIEDEGYDVEKDETFNADDDVDSWLDGDNNVFTPQMKGSASTTASERIYDGRSSPAKRMHGGSGDQRRRLDVEWDSGDESETEAFSARKTAPGNNDALKDDFFDS
ncbi:hypothetical protein HOLleu_07861 [Holothuria leucospilota]|uniref:SCAN box domain-containing protein n=1 Tax=Holothuria leucospilota TaxID=206669 RepID=A0A9Q1HHA6_HOLLE|nr:hypothetical protein HOLleu_07861 [Holothuria leucospilota]